MDKFLLAFETSGNLGGAALVGNGKVLASRQLNAGLRHGQGLLPAAQACLEEAGVSLDKLSAVAVDIGPGSYTGLRVGVMTAKALAFALKLPLVGVASLDAFALHLRSKAQTVAICIDARRDEVYFAVYSCAAKEASRRGEIEALSPEQALAKLEELSGKFVLAGNGLPRLGEDKVKKACPKCVVLEDPAFPPPEAVGLLGWRLWQEKPKGDGVHQLQPVYPRRADLPMQLLGELPKA